MPSGLLLRLTVAAVFALIIINALSYVLRSCYFAKRDELSGSRPTEDDPVISALRDVTATQQDTSDCRTLFGEQTSAHNFSMSEDFHAHIDEFLSAVRSSVAGSGDVEGSCFQMETEYRFLHYLTSRLRFVRKLCETGMTNYCIGPNEISVD